MPFARGLFATALFATTLCLTFACSPEGTGETQTDPSMRAAPTVPVHGGVVRGAWAEEEAGIAVFKGLPYAAPPIGDARFRPPGAYRGWTGERDATEFGPACIQPTRLEMWVWSRGDFEVSEDCLFLNVWSRHDAEQATTRPVMVWFHGGGHVSGTGADLIFDGTNLARRDVVAVTINYRLGPWGFLAHPALAAESSHRAAGNYGLFDKIAALNWVRDNIGQFGGDPDNVTIFGQSAGSASVCALMASPLAQGLFHKAIGQSAACVLELPAGDSAGLERGQRLVDALPGDGSADAMRAATIDDIFHALETTDWQSETLITRDGWLLPESPLSIFARGEHTAVPLLLGSMSNEGEQLIPLDETLTAKALRAYAADTFGQGADEVLTAYAADAAVSPGHAQWQIATDLFMAFAMRRWAGFNTRADAPTYLYFMDHAPPTFRLYVPENPALPGGPRAGGAYHSGDLALVFDNLNLVGLDWNEVDRRVANTLVTYWTNFAKNGNPNGVGVEMWPAYHPEHHTTQRLGESIESIAGARRAKLDAMDGALAR